MSISGSQSASAPVAGFPSAAASRIAVIGRQNSQAALSSQTAIRASAPVRYCMANIRAFSAMLSPKSADSTRATRVMIIVPSAQNSAAWV